MKVAPCHQLLTLLTLFTLFTLLTWFTLFILMTWFKLLTWFTSDFRTGVQENFQIECRMWGSRSIF